MKIKTNKITKECLDDLVREVLKLRDKKCRVCGSTKYLQVAHFITRSNYAVRWDLDNVFRLCSGCHMMRRNSWHKDPASCAEWVRKELGEERYNALRMRANTVGQRIDKWAVKIYLEEEMKKCK